MSGLEDKGEDIDKISNEYGNFRKTQEENMQEIWGTMKRTNLQIIGLEEIENFQDSSVDLADYIFNNTIEENFPKLRKTHPMYPTTHTNEHRTPDRQDHRRNSRACHS